jgi:hypothetical protein
MPALTIINETGGSTFGDFRINFQNKGKTPCGFQAYGITAPPTASYKAF